MNYQKVYMNQIHSSSLLCQLAQMWRSQLLCDALICTGNVVTKAHRVVLLAACPMLQSMENASIGTELEVRLAADIKQEAVNTFLQYLYEGFMLLTEDNVKHVEKVARLLQVDSVIKCCSDFFKCLEKSTGKMHNANYKFDKYDLLEFRHVRTSNLQKTYQDRLMKRMSESPRPTSPTLGKRPRMHRPSTPQSDPSSQRADDAISMTQSYMGALGSGGSGSVRSATSSQSSRSGSPSVVEIVEDSLELIQREKAGPGQPESSRLAQQKTSISVASHVSNAKDTRVVNIADDGGGGKTTDSSADRIHSIPSARESSQSSQKLPYRDTQPSQNFHPSSSSFIPRIPPNQPPSLIQMSQSFSQGHSQDPSSQPRPQPIPTESFMDKFPFMTSTPQRSIPPSGAKPSFAAGSATQSGPPSQSTTFPSPAASQSPSQKETPPVIDRTEKREGESNSRPQEGHDPGPSGGTGDIADLAIVKIEKVGEDEIGGLMMQVDQGHGDGQRLGQFTGDDEQEYDESDLTGEWSQEDLSNEGSMLQGDPSGSGAMYMGPTSAYRPRGRPMDRIWKKAGLFLVNKPMQSLKEYDGSLIKYGFGPPKVEVAIERQWSVEQLDDYVISCFSHLPLRTIGFNYAKCSKGGNFDLVYPNSVMHLASMIRWGKVYVIPKSDLCNIT